MRIDLYTKAVLRISAVMLTVIASDRFINPRVASAQGTFAGVQWNGNTSFFDSRTGEIWFYDRYADGVKLGGKWRLTKLGQPLTVEE